MRIWIFGDSFSTSTDSYSWTTLLGNTIIKSSNGSSEYRIWKTYQENKHKIKDTDKVIFCHTSPSRVFLKDDAELSSRTLKSHPKCDLLINDADENYLNLLSGIWNTSYTDDIFSLLVADLKNVPNSTHFTFFESTTIESLKDIWSNFEGDINHMSVLGNKMAYDAINKLLFPIKRIVSFGASLAQGTGLDDPTKESYIALIANKLQVPYDNIGIAGSSNMQTLHSILTYKFIEGDCAIVMWGPQDRDYLYSESGNIPMGAWQDKNHPELFNAWLNTHSTHDLGVRGWLNIHHAVLYLQSKNLKFFNFADSYAPFKKSKPDYIDAEIINSKKDFYRMFAGPAKDGKHISAKGHALIAERILHIMGY